MIRYQVKPGVRFVKMQAFSNCTRTRTRQVGETALNIYFRTWSNENTKNLIEMSITHGYERQIHHQKSICIHTKSWLNWSQLLTQYNLENGP